MPLRANSNRHIGTDMIRVGPSIMMISLGRPLTNTSLVFRNRVVRDHPTAGRRVRRLVGLVDNRNYNYKYSDYNNNYNSGRYNSSYNYRNDRYRGWRFATVAR